MLRDNYRCINPKVKEDIELDDAEKFDDLVGIADEYDLDEPQNGVDKRSDRQWVRDNFPSSAKFASGKVWDMCRG